MRGIGGSTLRGGQTVFHGIRMWGQLFQAALLFAAFMTVAVPAWKLWQRTTGAEWYAAGMVTLAEVKLVLGYDPDSGQEVEFADGTRRVLRIRDIAASVPVAVPRSPQPARLRHDGRRADPAAEGHRRSVLGDGGAPALRQRRRRAAPEGRDPEPGPGRPPDGMERPASTGRVRLAVLIDAENASASHAQAVFEAAETLGEARVRRVYGDFSNGRLASWSAAIRNFAIVPCHQPAHVKGKNAADIALAIDAVDLSYRTGLDGFLLVSSDSDFTRLAQRLREGGFAVYGFGERKTPQAFRAACHRFEIVGKAANGRAAAPEGRRKGAKR